MTTTQVQAPAKAEKQELLDKLAYADGKAVAVAKIQAAIDEQQQLLDAFVARKRPTIKNSTEFGKALRNAAQKNYQNGRNINGDGGRAPAYRIVKG